MCVQCSFRNPDCFADTCGSYFHSGSLLSTVTNRLLTGLKLFRVLAVPQIQSNKHKNGFPFLSQSSMLESYHVLPCLTMSYPHFQRDTARKVQCLQVLFRCIPAATSLAVIAWAGPGKSWGYPWSANVPSKHVTFCGWFFHRGSSNMSIPIIEIPRVWWPDDYKPIL